MLSRVMEIGAHLAAGDASRLRRVFDKFGRLGFVDYALTGGLALEAALAEKGSFRTGLNDIDLVVPGFAALPVSLGDGFLVHHVHRGRPKGKLILQLVCPDDAVRIDVFSGCGGLFARAEMGRVGLLAIRIAALEDMASRIVSELMSLVYGATAPAKAARDYHRLSGMISPSAVEAAWTEQRRRANPDTFAEACRAVEAVLASENPRLTTAYPFEARPACPHCGDVAPFRRADPECVRRLLGHH